MEKNILKKKNLALCISRKRLRELISAPLIAGVSNITLPAQGGGGRNQLREGKSKLMKRKKKGKGEDGISPLTAGESKKILFFFLNPNGHSYTNGYPELDKKL